SYRLVKYTKICYIPYGYSLLKNCTEYFASNFVFLRNISILFAENISDGKAFEKLFIDNINNRIQKVEYLGYPPLEKYLNFPQIELVKRITWAPRWTYDDKLGGSHFMEYKDFFLDLAKKLPEQLIIRPHPMMFENFRQKGIMNHAQINDYVRSANRLGVPLDDRSPIDQILENTDLLITDISSVIVLFFMTGRPIIYCKCNMEPNDELRKMLDGIYIAENQNEIEYYINNILNNNDYLKSKRADIIKNNLFDVNYNSTNKIVENLYYSATN
ncbi:MAG: CDP-glycerol glycerophosphotransferase family protein, partial [Bacilli bacterium]